MATRPTKLGPLAGIDNFSKRDDALQVGGQAQRLYLRDAVNMDISETGRASLRPGLRKVGALALTSLWQSPLHRDVFAVEGSNWVKVDPLTWTTEAIASIGPGPAQHLVLNNVVLAAGADGIFQYDGVKAQRFTLSVPPAPMVSAGAGSLSPGAYGVAMSWLRGAMESPVSPITHCTVGEGGALAVTLPLCLDASVTGVRMYLTRTDGGELLRGEDYPVGLPYVELPLLPKLGAAAQFQHMEPMPTGKFFGQWRGRLVSARANVVRFSQALAYHVHDPRHDFVLMPQRITFLQPVDGGIWVGQVDHVAFLSGTQPDELQLMRKTSKAPVPGSALALDAATAGDMANGGSAVVAWLAENGYVLGSADGIVVERHANRLQGISGNQSTSIVFRNRITTAVT